MFYIARRNFLRSVFGVGTAFSLSIIFNKSFLEDFNNRFICQDFYLMGTYGKIQIFCDDIYHGNFFIKKAVNSIKKIEKCLTKFSPFSDIGIMNRRPFEYHSVSLDTLNVLNIGSLLSEKTFGYFDMGLGNLLSYSGIDTFVPIVGGVTKVDDMNKDLFISFDGKVMLNRPNSMIDLGGIGKGFAIDTCLKVLVDNGIKHAAVEFGGDVRVFGGMPNKKPWKVSFDKKLFKFFDQESLSFDIVSGGISVSGSYIKKSINGNHHIIDPYVLGSKNDYLFLVVLGEECVVCDALSTAYFNMDVNMIKKSISAFPGYSFKVYL